MTIVRTRTKAKLAGKAAKTAAKHPSATWTGVRRSVPALKVVFGVGRPVAKRRVRRRMQRLGAAGRFAAGVAVGAGAVYFLEPERGRAHRQRVA